MRKLNKKGEGDAGLSIQQILFYAAELAVGALVIVLVLQMVSFAVRDAESQIIARDFAATLKTSSVYPYTSYFEYPADLSTGSINIYEDSVRVNIDKGSHTAPLSLARGVSVEERNFLNPQSVPIIKFRNEFFFSGEDLYEINCDKFYKLSEGQKIFFMYESRLVEQEQNLDELRKGINLIHEVKGDESKISVITRDSAEALKIRISFNTEDDNLLVYDSSRKEHEGFVCYLREEYLNRGIADKPTLFLDYHESEEILLLLPSTNYLEHYLTNERFEDHRNEAKISSEIDLMQVYAQAIYTALEKTIR